MTLKDYMEISLLKISILLSSIMILFNPSLYSQSSINDTVKLDEIIVTGTKIAVSRNYVPLTVSVISQKEIEESSESALLPVLTERVPGLFVTERGITGFGVSTGSAGQISIRGIGSQPNTQVLVLLNGNPQYMGIFGHPLADAYVASDIERVEVIRGPASTLYGSNAMGGVINIITKKQEKDGFNINSRFMYGSYNTQKYMLNAGYKKGSFNIFVGINHDRTDGHRDSSDFAITNAYLRLSHKLNKDIKTSIDFSLADFDASDPGPAEGKAGNSIDILRGMGAFSLNNDFGKISGSLRLFYNFGEHNISDGFHSKDFNYGLIFYEALQFFEGNTITIGLDYKNYGGNAENTLVMNGKGIVFTDTSLYEIGSYILVQQKLLQKMMLNAGFRIEHNHSFGNNPVPSVGIAYNLKENSTLKASVSKGFRSPTIRELFMWETANDSLQPENMLQYEIAYSMELFRNKLYLDMALYTANGDNLIKTINEGGQLKYFNSGEFNNWGFEVAAKIKARKDLDFLLNYSFISMSEPIIATPEHQLNFNGTWEYKSFTFNLSLQNIINLYLKTGDEEIRESYCLVNSRIAYKINSHFDMFLKVENILDTKYQINYEYPMPGIIAFAGINLHF